MNRTAWHKTAPTSWQSSSRPVVPPPPLTLARKHRTPPSLGLGNNWGPAAGGIAPTPPIGHGVWPWVIRLDIVEVWVAVGGAEGHHYSDNCSPEASIVANPHSTAGRSPSCATLGEMTIPSSAFTSITCCTCWIEIRGQESQTSSPLRFLEFDVQFRKE
jgi:hypothetical protein